MVRMTWMIWTIWFDWCELTRMEINDHSATQHIIIDKYVFSIDVCALYGVYLCTLPAHNIVAETSTWNKLNLEDQLFLANDLHRSCQWLNCVARRLGLSASTWQSYRNARVLHSNTWTPGLLYGLENATSCSLLGHCQERLAVWLWGKLGSALLGTTWHMGCILTTGNSVGTNCMQQGNCSTQGRLSAYLASDV